MSEQIQKVFSESQAILLSLASDSVRVGMIGQIARKIVESFRRGNKLLLMGNGGSAADAQHIAAEFVGRFKLERHALPAIALTTNSSILTALSNDYSFEELFARQVKALAIQGDVLLGISTSGNSRNVLTAFQIAREMGAFTIGLTGEPGGQMDAYADWVIKVPSDNTARIQEALLVVEHLICEIVEQEITCSNAIGGGR